LVAYWDTANVSVGTYELLIRLNYAGKRTEKRMAIDIEEYAIKPHVVKAEVPKWRIIIISILVIIALVVYVKRKSKR